MAPEEYSKRKESLPADSGRKYKIAATLPICSIIDPGHDEGTVPVTAVFDAEVIASFSLSTMERRIKEMRHACLTVQPSVI
ncbi:hypothetical protein [Bradyrhizobium sp. WSM471]|uniref:hypothetical protein n=1 Tax=Bradyrhizobium sp. WSM471 TaxID=319017 RepID=UPI0012FB0C12|nr:MULTISPECIES: hypothetical protein [Bradyrhizobium]UFW42937.1 hypothetical protein BcanWSM471_07205 [Bradyrhizobium canariense]